VYNASGVAGGKVVASLAALSTELAMAMAMAMPPWDCDWDCDCNCVLGYWFGSRANTRTMPVERLSENRLAAWSTERAVIAQR